MRVVQIYNQQRSSGGGEEKVVMQTTAWLRERGVETDLLLRSSRGIENSFLKKVQAAVTGIYNPEAYRFMRAYLARHRPSIVHAHNLYPQWSAAVLAAGRDAGVATLFTVHCQVLTCPTWYHLHKNRVCEKCCLSGEHWCILQNCRQNIVESAVYALRHFIVRKRGLFRDNVTIFIAPSKFMRGKLLAAGFSADQVRVIWNAVAIPEQPADPKNGGYVAFAGRLSPEKGVGTVLAAARTLPDVQFQIAGGGPLEQDLVRQAPANVRFVGFLDRDGLARFYRGARLHVVPSVSYEAFPLSAAEAMSFGLPVIASQIGGLPEMVDENVTGLLVEPGNAEMLSAKIRALWDHPHRCHEMGSSGRKWAEAHLTKDVHIASLLAAYEDALDISAAANGDRRH